jgi:type VI secretion system protein VasG
VETGARNVDHIIRGTLMPRMSRQLLERMSAGPMPSSLRIALGADGQFDLLFGD